MVAAVYYSRIEQTCLKMKIEFVNPETVLAPDGNYSHAVEISGHWRQLYISGQIPETHGAQVPADFESQCRIVWQNIAEILKAADMSFSNLVKVTTFLADRNYAAVNGRIRREFLGDLRPALTVVVVETLDRRWLLEIEAIAVADW